MVELVGWGVSGVGGWWGGEDDVFKSKTFHIKTYIIWVKFYIKIKVKTHQK